MSENPAVRRLGLVELFLWSLAVAALVYFGTFGLLLCDSYLKGRFIDVPLRHANPELHARVTEILRLTYGPLLWVLQSLNVGL